MLNTKIDTASFVVLRRPIGFQQFVRCRILRGTGVRYSILKKRIRCDPQIFFLLFFSPLLFVVDNQHNKNFRFFVA